MERRRQPPPEPGFARREAHPTPQLFLSTGGASGRRPPAGVPLAAGSLLPAEREALSALLRVGRTRRGGRRLGG